MDRIKLSEIFDLSDFSEIKKAADRIASELGSALDSVKERARDLQAELRKVQPGEQLLQMSADAEKLGKQYASLADAQKQLNAQTKLLTQSQEELDKSTKQVNEDTAKAEQAQEEAANSVAELRKQVKAAKKEYEGLSGSLGDTSEEARQAKQRFFELDKQLKDHNKALREDAKTAQMANDSYNSWQATVRQAEQRIKALEDPMGKNREEAQRLTKVINENKDKLKQFDASIGNFQRNVGNYRSALDGVKGSLKEMLLMGGIAGAATAGVEMLKESVLYAAKYDDALADVRKTTGMTQEETQKLSEQLAQLDTRTSQMDLVNIAKIGGSVGVAKEQMAGFVESVDKAVVALGDEFTGGAEEVANALGRIKGLFQETRGLEFGDAMNRIGSMMNELGAISSATAPNIADFMQRVGQLGSMSPSIDAVAALGAVLQDAGLSAEIASGGFTNVVLTMGKELPKFQDYIMGNKEAAELLKQEGGNLAEVFNKDTAKAVNILAAAFKGVPADKVVNDLGNLKIGSQESIKVLQALAVKQSDYNKFLGVANAQLKEATSLTNEFNVKNNTQQAFLDKVVKKFKEMTLVVGQWLWGAFGRIIEVLQKVYEALEPVINFVGALVAGFFKVAETIFGVVLEAIEAVADAFSWLWGSTSDAEEALEAFTEQTAEAVAEVDGLFMSLDKTTHTQEENKKAMEAINAQYGKYLPNLLTEKSSLEEIAAARQLIIDAIYAEMAAKMKQEAINEAIASNLKEQMKAQKVLADLTGYSQGKIVEFAKFEERVALARWANDKAFLSQNAEKINALEEFRDKVESGGAVAVVAWQKTKSSQDQLKQSIGEINEAFDPYIKSVQTYDHSAKKATETTDGMNGSVSNGTADMDKNTEATKKNTEAKKANYDVTDELLQKQILEDYKQKVSDSIDATIDLTDAEYEQAKLRREQMEIMQELQQKDYEIRKEQLTRQLERFTGEGKNELEVRKKINKDLFDLEMERIRMEMEILESQGKTKTLEYEKLLTEQQKLTLDYFQTIENAKPKKSVFQVLAEDTDELIDALNRLSDVTGGDDSKFGRFVKNMAAVVQVGQGFASTAVSLKGFRDGGYTGDIPADAVAGVVHGGEYVLTAQEVQRLGKQNIELWKEGKTPMQVNALPMGLDLEELGRVIAKNVPTTNLDPIAGAIATTKKELGKVIQVIRKTR